MYKGVEKRIINGAQPAENFDVFLTTLAEIKKKQ
jgi:hypothetical protein